VKVKVAVKSTADKAIRELEKINKAMKKGGDKVMVGLPKSSNDYPDGTSVIMVGAVHEFGSTIRNVPERSFLRSTLRNHKKKYKSLFVKLSKKIIKGEMDKKKALSLIGTKVQTDVRQKITDIKEPVLKNRDGNPLIDTGHLRQSIIYEIDE